jgi:hypothetical protein
MFAGEAFAQLAFAQIGGAFFIDSTAETITFTDSQSAQANFVGVQAETATYTTTQAASVDFAPTIAETATFTDSQAGTWATNLILLGCIFASESGGSILMFFKNINSPSQEKFDGHNHKPR